MSWQVVDGHRQLEQTTDPETGEGIWSFNATGALRGFELLGTHMAMFVDRQEITNTDLGSELDSAVQRTAERTPGLELMDTSEEESKHSA